MKERPILFSGEMVRAILVGWKTQTRRVVKPQPPHWEWTRVREYAEVRGLTQQVGGLNYWIKPCPYGQVGDRLWVRETFAKNEVLPLEHRPAGDYIYRADLFNGVSKYSARWLPSIFCTRAASRITLEVVNILVELLHDITRGDAMSEGCPHPNMADGPDPRAWYAQLWEKINGANSWDANPWVWVIEFRRIKP